MARSFRSLRIQTVRFTRWQLFIVIQIISGIINLVLTFKIFSTDLANFELCTSTKLSFYNLYPFLTLYICSVPVMKCNLLYKNVVMRIIMPICLHIVLIYCHVLVTLTICCYNQVLHKWVLV